VTASPDRGKPLCGKLISVLFACKNKQRPARERCLSL
jgi:hypothetical protein